MSRRKPLTRRQRALFRLGALALVVAAFFLLVGYSFTPEEALTKSRRKWGLTGAPVVRDLGDVGLEETGYIQGWLAGDERGLLFCGAAFRWTTGWESVMELAVDCRREGQSLYGGIYLLSGGWQAERCFLFGHVKDPAVVRVEMAAEIQDKTDDKPRIVRAEWIREGQEQDFCIEPGWRPWKIYGLKLTGYDGKGRKVEQVNCPWIKET